MAQLNIFENIPTIFDGFYGAPAVANTVYLQYVYIPGSISFNKVALLLSGPPLQSCSSSVSFGLYSLNGSTLSLANSASNTIAFTINNASWFTLITSATQNITPGEWFFGFKRSSSGNFDGGIFQVRNIALTDGVYGGPFFRGIATATDLPSSIATSDCTKEGSSASNILIQPYILIGA